MSGLVSSLKSIVYPPNDFGLDNEKNRKSWLKDRLQALPSGQKILDAGAGELANKIYCEHLKYTSQDICQYDGKGDGAGLHTTTWVTSKIDLVSDITNIPVPDGSFDAVLCSEVLEHVSEPEKALSEFSRILKKDGTLILTAPFGSLTHFAPYHYASGFNRYFYEHHLGKLGFEIVELQPNGNFFSFIAQELFRVPLMAQEFSRFSFNFFHKVFLLFCIRLLYKISRSDKGSSSVLCYGYNVLARKK